MRSYLMQEFGKLHKSAYQEAILGHLGYEEQTARLALINKKIGGIIRADTIN